MMLVVIAVATALVCLGFSIAIDRPLQDTEGFLGSVWLRLPLLVIGAFFADVIPRTLYRARTDYGRYGAEARRVITEHWTRDRITLVVVGLASFYVTYISYRNLKNFLPFVMSEDGRPKIYDRALHRMDEWLMFGSDPSTILHTVLGTSVTAHVLSVIYLFFLPMVPVSVAVWAVWSRRTSYGWWFITAQCICWALGTASYYALPSLGPNFEYFPLYADLPDTGVKNIQDMLANDRADIVHNPLAQGVQSVAGFASLHVAITLMLALVGHYTLRTRALRVGLWTYAVLTVLATTYFGWHYIADDLAGAAIAVVAVYVAGIGTGQTFDRSWLHDPNPAPLSPLVSQGDTREQSDISSEADARRADQV